MSARVERNLSIEEQLELWVKGEPIHNSGRGECCPDFSCCQPQLLAPADVREAFAEADEQTRQRMLMMFLGAAFAEMGKSAHIAGDTASYRVPS